MAIPAADDSPLMMPSKSSRTMPMNTIGMAKSVTIPGFSPNMNQSSRATRAG